ncbi:MAG TPA: disulfide bond formation protein B [Croceibacterium sp.]|nr:disulfide bond formation protein B [Croceibacterium sp.]
MTALDKLAQRLAIGVPALLLGGAYLSQYGFGLFPCEMCWWQRYAHFAALALALVSTFAASKRLWIGLAGVAILVAGLLGAYHAGVEYHWWEGLTTCSSTAAGSSLEDILNAPLIRCDQPQWTLFGISLAGFNFLFSTIAAVVILVLLGRREQGAKA